MRYILFLFLISCGQDEFITPHGCMKMKKKELVCTMEIDYVCGCNGYLYANECWAMRDGNDSWTSATIETNCKE